jgi:hypothetical protein
MTVMWMIGRDLAMGVYLQIFKHSDISFPRLFTIKLKYKITEIEFPFSRTKLTPQTRYFNSCSLLNCCKTTPTRTPDIEIAGRHDWKSFPCLPAISPRYHEVQLRVL